MSELVKEQNWSGFTGPIKTSLEQSVKSTIDKSTTVLATLCPCESLSNENPLFPTESDKLMLKNACDLKCGVSSVQPPKVVVPVQKPPVKRPVKRTF